MAFYFNSRYGFTKNCPDSMCKIQNNLRNTREQPGRWGDGYMQTSCECDILLSETPTVDGRNPANQLRLVPGAAEFLPSTVWQEN